MHIRLFLIVSRFLFDINKTYILGGTTRIIGDTLEVFFIYYILFDLHLYACYEFETINIRVRMGILRIECFDVNEIYGQS